MCDLVIKYFFYLEICVMYFLLVHTVSQEAHLLGGAATNPERKLVSPFKRI